MDHDKSAVLNQARKLGISAKYNKLSDQQKALWLLRLTVYGGKQIMLVFADDEAEARAVGKGLYFESNPQVLNLSWLFDGTITSEWCDLEEGTDTP